MSKKLERFLRKLGPEILTADNGLGNNISVPTGGQHN